MSRRKRKTRAVRREVRKAAKAGLACTVCGQAIKDDDPVLIRGGLRHVWCTLRG